MPQSRLTLAILCSILFAALFSGLLGGCSPGVLVVSDSAATGAPFPSSIPASASAGPTVASDAATTDDGALTAAQALPEEEFWELIDVLGGSSDPEAVQRLTSVLRARGEDTTRRFAERLAERLHHLDREALFRRPVRWSDDPPWMRSIPLSADTFLYLRADIVARGRETYEAVLADPAVLDSRVWDDGEALLRVADQAAGKRLETQYSYETGSNDEHWS